MYQLGYKLDVVESHQSTKADVSGTAVGEGPRMFIQSEDLDTTRQQIPPLRQQIPPLLALDDLPGSCACDTVTLFR
eukprot:2643691-Amphidinium_carterae.1